MRKAVEQLLERIYRLAPGLDEEQGMQRHLSRGSFWTLVIHFGHMALVFLTAYLLTRWLGAEEYGRYTYVYTWLLVLVTAGSIGADDLLLKELPTYRANGRPAHARGLILHTFRWTLLANLILALLFAALLYSGLWPKLSAYRSLFYLLLPVLPLYALTHWAMAGLRAEQHLITAQWPEKIARPLLFLALIGAWALWVGSSPTADTALSLLAFCLGLIALLYLGLFRDRVWRTFSGAGPARQEIAVWRGQLLFFFLLPLLNILNTRLDILLLGHFTDDTTVGIYSIAAKLSDIIPFSLILFQNVFSPLYARYHSTGQLQRLQALLRRGVRLSLLLALPIALALLLGGRYILGWFGPEFPAGYGVLLILSPAQLVFMAIGPLAFLLMMIGQGRATFRIMAAGLALTAGLQALLIPWLGMEGAAIGRAAGMLATNGAYAWWLYRSTGVRTV